MSPFGDNVQRAVETYKALGFDDRCPYELVSRTFDQAKLDAFGRLQRAREAVRSEFPNAWLHYISPYDSWRHREPLSSLCQYLRTNHQVSHRDLDAAVFESLETTLPERGSHRAFNDPRVLYNLLHCATRLPDWFLESYRNNILVVPRTKEKELTFRLLPLLAPSRPRSPVFLKALASLEGE